MHKKFVVAISMCLLLLLSASVSNAVESIIREAESYDSLTAPFVVLEDAAANGGEYIVNPAEGGPSNTNPPTTGIAKYNITIEEGGTYKLFLRVLCTVGGDGDDSCYVRIQGSTPSIAAGADNWINSNNIDRQMAAAATEVWFWAQVQQYDGPAWPGGLVEFEIPKGSRTIEIAYREDGLKIDTLILTNDPEASTTNLPLPVSSSPNPENDATDVSLNTKLSWKPGVFAETHNVFLGTDINEVKDATIAEHENVLVFEALDVNSVNPGMLAFGTEYFWRVDDVDAESIHSGAVWSFTSEPEGIALTFDNIENVTAYTPIIVNDSQEPNMTCDGSGLNANDMHSTSADDTMWLGYSDDPEDPVWIQYEFDKIYKFFELDVWNYNEIYPNQEYGSRDVNVTYSIDGENWDALDDIIEFQMATGDDTYTANTFVDMNGVAAKYIKLTFLSSWTEGAYTGGLSEVRFLVIPTRARTPNPENDADDIALETVLSWEPGRDADSHKVYIGSDSNDVRDGIANIIQVTTDPNYSATLELAKTYYWKVEEVNNAEAYTTWDGPVWSFKTIESIIVENFEVGYDTADANAVWMTWSDGYYDENNGAEIGKELSAPGLSEDITHGGDYSAPVTFNNSGNITFSEVTAQTADLPIGKADWSMGAPKTLTIWFRGDVNNIAQDGQLYCKIGGKKAEFGGDSAALMLDKWYKWDIDLDTLGVNISNIPEITIGIEDGSTDCTGVFYIDDIMLTGLAAQSSYSIYIEAEDADSFTSGMKVQTETAGYLGSGYIASDPAVTEPQTNMTENGVLLGVATYNVDIAETGEYRIAFRDYVYTDANNANFNSFWVKVTGPDVVVDANLVAQFDWANFNEIPAGSWLWRDVWNGTGTPLNYTISEAGTYTIQVAYRELGNRLDAIEIRKTGELSQ